MDANKGWIEDGGQKRRNGFFIPQRREGAKDPDESGCKQRRKTEFLEKGF